MECFHEVGNVPELSESVNILRSKRGMSGPPIRNNAVGSPTASSRYVCFTCASCLLMSKRDGDMCDKAPCRAVYEEVGSM